MAVLKKNFRRHGANFFVSTRQHILVLFVPEKSILNKIFVPCAGFVPGYIYSHVSSSCNLLSKKNVVFQLLIYFILVLQYIIAN